MSFSATVQPDFLSRLVEQVISKRGHHFVSQPCLSGEDVPHSDLGNSGLIFDYDEGRRLMIYSRSLELGGFVLQYINFDEVVAVACIRHGNTIVPEPGAEKVLTPLGEEQILVSSRMVLDLFGLPSWIGYSPPKRTEKSARIGWDLVSTPMIREQPEFFYGPLIEESSDVEPGYQGYLDWCERVKVAGGTVAGALDMGDETTYAHLARVQMRRAVVDVAINIRRGKVAWVYGHGDMIPFVANDPEAMPCPMPEASVVVCLVDRRKREILATAFANCPLND